MEIENYGNFVAVVPSDTEMFGHRFFSGDDYQIKLIPELLEWLDTISGRWTTNEYTNRVSIAFDSMDNALLFKLTWQGSDVIERNQDHDYTAFYCPYIPLTFNSGQFNSNIIQFTTRYNLRTNDSNI